MSLYVDIKKKCGNFILHSHIDTQSQHFGILGASGSGKSMTFRLIAGIDRPDSGIILLNNRVLYDSQKKIHLPTRDRKIGYLFQSYALFPHMTVLQNVKIGMHLPQKERTEKAREILARFDLLRLEQLYPSQLSGGQKQRVAMARILACDTELLLLDEPFSALDIHLKEQIKREVSMMLHVYNGTTIMVTHALDEAFQFCEELMILENGQSICQEKTKTLFDHCTYTQVARLMNCKNIIAIDPIDSHTVRLHPHNLLLKTSQPVEKDITHIGIHAHHIILSKLAISKENVIPITIKERIQSPLHSFYIATFPVTKNSPSGELWIAESQLCKGKEANQLYAYLPKEHIMLLKE